MKNRIYLIAFVLIGLVYAAFAIFAPSDPKSLQKYHLTQSSAHLIGLTVVLPMLVIWFCAFYGFSVFKSYARIIKDSPEGKSLDKISNGLMVLAFSLPVNAALGAALSFIAVKHPHLTAASTIIRNYVSLLLTFITFTLIGDGAEGLTKLIKRKTTGLYDPKIWALGLIILSSVYSWLIIARSTWGVNSETVYALPNWLIISTIAVPYVYIWFRGLLAAYYIWFYQRNVKGPIYRHALAYLSAGIFSVIGILILIQLLATVSSQLSRLHLTPILLVIYALVALYAVGFVFIAIGAKKLQKIEEV